MPVKYHQNLYSVLVILCLGLFTLAGCDSQSTTELPTGRWGMPDGSGMMLVDLPHGKLELWRAFAGGAFPVLQAKNLKIEKEESNPQQVTVSYDVSGKRKMMTLRIIWQHDGERFYLAIADQFSGRITRLNFMSGSPDMTYPAGDVK